VKLALGDAVAGFGKIGSGVSVQCKSGRTYSGDLVILSIGVRPETTLAKQAGLQIGDRGGIRVDEQMRTSDPAIWAVGDAVEVKDAVTGSWVLIPLAGPASRQGRIAADSICGRTSTFRGTQGTAICGVLGQTIAMTGASEKTLQRAGITDYDKVYLHPHHHAAYYPGAQPFRLKLLFRKSDGRLLGAQAVGGEGVDKRIDVIAMAIQKEGTVFDLEEAELCYAPQFGSAKDAVNIAGMAAANIMHGDVQNASWSSLEANGFVLLDVRQPEEFVTGHVEGATNIPLPELRARFSELPKGKAIRVYCQKGQRGYYASRLLKQKGFTVENLSGGYETFLTL
jgi:rhodanese-related sulfurtransferase